LEGIQKVLDIDPHHAEAQFKLALVIQKTLNSNTVKGGGPGKISMKHNTMILKPGSRRAIPEKKDLPLCRYISD